MGWETSNRRDELPPNWQSLRRQAKARARGRCERVVNGQRCRRFGTDLNHTDRDNHALASLEWLCPQHHKQETNQQAKTAQRAKYVDAKRRPREAHPGAKAGALPWL